MVIDHFKNSNKTQETFKCGYAGSGKMYRRIVFPIFNLDNNLKNSFDIVVSNPPFYKRENNRSKNKLEDSSKRIVNLKEWLENSLKLLKQKNINKLNLYLLINIDQK